MTVNAQVLANAIRILAMDAVQKANSGHPGMPMGMADIAEVLWRRFLKHNPKNPNWANRDRFVLSNGHGSMLIYALLHLTGYDLSIDDLKNFRQLHAKTPGHPEYGYTAGVETTTGPLGQGISNAVGMALAEKLLAAQFNRPQFPVVDHYTYVFLGDGCLMEGISHEVCSLAGTLQLGKLIVFYDDNGISIDGHVEGWFTDNTPKRFESYGWQVIPNIDGHNAEAIEKAIQMAQQEANRPTLICCKTVIGQGSPNKAGSHDCHGAPLGNNEIEASRQALGWTHPAFEIPTEIKMAWDATDQGANAESVWQDLFTEYTKVHPELATAFQTRLDCFLPQNWSDIAAAHLQAVETKAENIASRKASQNCIEFLAPHLPALIGGSADLASSNLTTWSGSKGAQVNPAEANYIHYGVREFGMVGIMNGLALSGGFIPYGGTFLVFSDYARNALRMAALMKLRSLYVFTHDSIGLGEDGPTHQPIEHAASLRLIPNMDVWRPCDTFETAIAWHAGLERKDGPVSLLLSRQNLPYQTRSDTTKANVSKGAYVLADFAEGKKQQLIIIATGSEVALAMQAKTCLEQETEIAVRVVSMPSSNVFDRQDHAYKINVLPAGIKRIAIEAASVDFWYKYVGLDGAILGMNRFGESAPAGKLFDYFGLTTENLVKTAKTLCDIN